MTRNTLALVLSLALPLVLGAGACGGGTTSAPVSPATQPAAPAQLETAEQVIEASLVAQGGRERLGKLTSVRQSGTLLIPQMGAKGTISIVNAPPRNALTSLDLPGFGKIVQGVSGDVAWELSPMTGNRLMTGAELSALLRDSTFNAELVWKELYPKAELVGIVDFQGTEAYKVVLTPPEGEPQTRYFAKDTLLPVGMQTINDTQMGKVPGTVAISDFRDIGGIKYPHKMVRTEGPVTIEVTLDKVELDAPIPPTTFDVPPEIQALQKK